MKKTLTCLGLSILSFSIANAQTTVPKTYETALTHPVTLPAIFPTPVSIKLGNTLIPLTKSVVLIEAKGTDPEIAALIRSILKSSGVENIVTAQQLPNVLNGLYFVIGNGDASILRSALSRNSAQADSHAEGYTIASTATGTGALITLAGKDADGLFHAAQTFRQLIKNSAIPEIVIQDHPAMPVRGTIEGFYGAPWSMEARKKHLNFLGTVKANTYVYSPKDDPYARDRWREAYPKAVLTDLGKLVSVAHTNHINFVYAISPGPSLCFSDTADLHAIERKFDALRSIGVHNFYVALDDIEYTKWNCEIDKTNLGAPSAEAAGAAQSKFLNAVQASLNAHDPEAKPLIMVPTEYYDAKESLYKAALRKNLDPKIVVQWTGTDVVPPAIAISDAKAATKAFGRKTLLWDNYPVNDYAQTTGRLLLAPYARREAGLSDELTGILSNPMNQEAPSRVAVTGVAAFSWNDKAYDAERTLLYAARALTGGDEQATAALLIFFDTQHMAPTFGSQPWQPQAPRLKMLLDGVRDAIAVGDDATRHRAITQLNQQAAEFAGAPDIIRSGVIDTAFAREARPWLDAMQLWGRALQLTAAGLEAANNKSAAAGSYFANAKLLAAQAAAIRTLPGVTRTEGPIKIADGVLDEFVNDAPTLINFGK
ncbi:beta-N-acetylglucosaminidase domain-containing protein [Mucilaginibacter sp. CAU 1740]|uniref:beta-N-acetylhexosaminidase family protein n=1 Tax=Mucilaginibacter sp. CAU 1740 TaxID=3140365 RepID=UPI00325A6C2D